MSAYGLMRIGPSGLLAPEEYWCMSPAEIAYRSNGCGPAAAKIDLIPDSLLGLPVEDACNVHDIMYGQGQTKLDKRLADCVFLFNLMVLVNAEAEQSLIGKGLRVARREAAFCYYRAVADWGDEAFWDGKEKPA